MDKTQSKPNRFTRKKVTLYSFLLLGLVIICVVAWQIFLYVNPQARVDFSVYEPKELPAGFSIKDTSIDIWSNRLWFTSGVGIDSPFPYAVRVTQTFNKNGWSISQERNKGFDYTCPANQALSTCQTQSTKNGQRYTLAVNTYSQPFTTAEEYADFIKGDTHITIRVRTDTSHLMPATEWSDVIDSFMLTSLAGVNAHYYHPGP
jgi:hypothetical protein